MRGKGISAEANPSSQRLVIRAFPSLPSLPSHYEKNVSSASSPASPLSPPLLPPILHTLLIISHCLLEAASTKESADGAGGFTQEEESGVHGQ